MREIKFRIWDSSVNRFLKNTYAGEEPWLDERGTASLTEYSFWTYQQFTGLYDKNKNPIYEGDIVDYRYDGMSEYDKERYADLLVSPVYWDYERWRIKYSAASYAWHLMEVVGNIFENPDLLK